MSTLDIATQDDESSDQTLSWQNRPQNIQQIGESLAKDPETETVFRGTAGGAALGAYFGPAGVLAGAGLGWLVGNAFTDDQ